MSKNIVSTPRVFYYIYDMANECKVSKRLLPVGIQSFPKIRESGCVYVDKTPQIYRMLCGTPGAFFLSRPRRFGKSLLCSTLGAIFEGRRDLFGATAGHPALAMDSFDWEWKRHPVIRIDLNAGDYTNGVPELKMALRSELEAVAEKYGIALTGVENHPVAIFKYVIRKVCEKIGEKAVVLIDEYDKPLTGTLTSPDLHIEFRGELKAFYSVLKSCDDYLRFVFITGVSKFSHVSIFSDLNQLKDLTLDPNYADLCGVTQEELEADFGPEIDGVLERTGRSRESYLDKLRRFYNGYRFTEAPLTVYNPFGLLNHFDSSGEFSDYWYGSATPSFLVDLLNLHKVNIQDLGNMRVEYNDFGKYDVENMKAAPLLYQTGYLTITDYDEERRCYTLDYPNEAAKKYSRSG